MKPGELKHYRNGPDMDVAVCGERGSQVVFSKARGNITCGVCKVRLQKAIDSKRVKREMAARARFFKAQAS